MSKIYIPVFSDLLPSLDMETVAQAVVAPDENGHIPKYTQDEYENIKEMILACGEKWLGRDIVEFQINGVEQLTLDEGLLIKAYTDVSGTLRGKVKPFDEYAGKTFVVDWKTRDGELDQRWRTRLIDSWQWRIYSALTGAAVFCYRGVSRRCGFEPCATKEILIGVPETNSDEVVEYLNGLRTQRDALINSKYTVWPRNFPDACNMYNRECPFKTDCDEYTMPRYTPEYGKVMSYTSWKYFLRCPEFSRRMLITPDADETEASNIGDGVHKGLANMWSQAKNIKL